MTKKEYAKYQKTVEEFFRENGIHHLSTSHYQCPECKVPFECSACPECGAAAGSFVVEAYFSGRPCECCGEHLAGDRMDANSYSEKSESIVEFTICQSCEYYAEYGRLPDDEMAEI